MRQDWSKNYRSSWPKLVVKKWLNIRSRADEFHSDYSMQATTHFNERRKSCSDEGKYVIFPNELSENAGIEGWPVEAPESLKRPRFEPEAPAVADNLRMFVGTWNVGGKSPHEGLNLKDWLRTPTPADVYVLGFQEIVPLNAGNVLGAEDNGPASKWLSLIRQALNSNEKDPDFGSNFTCATTPDWNSVKPRVSFSDLLSLEDELDKEESTSNYNSSEDGSPTRQSSPASSRYCLAASKQMVGILLCVWVRSDLNRHVSNLKVSCVGRGIMGYLGNKGSISISMTLHQTTFCFVCTHLTSGEKEGDEVRRNSDVIEILKKTRFSQSQRLPGQSFSPEKILEHDKIIWLGDLNYRLASRCGNTYELLKRNDWQALLEKDQLRIEQRAGRVFEGWEEGRISFAPTYKYLTNSDHYVAVARTSKSKEKRRTPAWCDRILWRGEGLKQMGYMRGESKFSDHRPVYSLFSVQVDVVNKNKFIRRSNIPPPPTCCTRPMSSACVAKVQAEEQLHLTRAQSCIASKPRF